LNRAYPGKGRKSGIAVSDTLKYHIGALIAGDRNPLRQWEKKKKIAISHLTCYNSFPAERRSNIDVECGQWKIKIF
jgi:hypothetical protein